jgi:hypothetical protein
MPFTDRQIKLVENFAAADMTSSTSFWRHLMSAVWDKADIAVCLSASRVRLDIDTLWRFCKIM